MNFEPDFLVTIDFETFYSGEYQLKKLTTVDYVRDPRFQVIGVGVQVNDGEPVWLEEADFRAWAKTVDWKRAAMLVHNFPFDGLITSTKYGIVPGLCLDTLSMAHALHTVEVGGSLGKLMKHYQVGEKGDEVVKAKGKRREDFTEEEWLRYGDYCKNDVKGCHAILLKMLDEGFPENELWLIDDTLRMFVEPKFVLDEPMMQRYLIDERARKAALLERINKDKSLLMSNDKFAELLFELGVEPPTKISLAKSKKAGHDVETWAFAKSDPGMQDLLEDEREEVRWVVEARVAIKSTINETRTERFLKLGANGQQLPVFLKYAGAHTFRWCMPEGEVLTRDGWVRMDEHQGQGIAQWAPKDGSVTWSHQTSMNKFPYSGEVIRVDTKGVRGRFTPEHTFARWTTTGAFAPITAEEACGINLRVPVSGVLQADGVEISDGLLRLVVAVQADGNIEDPTSRPLRFKFRKQRKMERLRHLLNAACIPFTEFDASHERAFSIARRHVPQELWAAKVFGWGLLNLDEHQRKVFLEELRFWDGVPTSPLTRYSTTSKQNAEVVATLAHLSGYAANIYTDFREQRSTEWSDKHEVDFHPKRFMHVGSSSWSREQYTGDVFCPTTQTGYFLVRCGGRIHVTGNSGGERANWQNLERTNKKDPNKGVIRKALRAPAGEMVVVADSSQIEARITAWLANHTELVAAFAEDRDVYSEFASTVYNRHVDRKANPEDEIPGHVGKASVLGLGFQLGYKTFAAKLLQGMLGGPPVIFTEVDAKNMGVNVGRFTGNAAKVQAVEEMPSRIPLGERLIHCAVAEAVVYKYRNNNRPIVELWGLMDAVLNAMLFEKEEEGTFGPGEFLQTVRHGILLPSGLVMKYRGLSRTSDGDGFKYLGGKSGRQVVYAYGGSITENVVQALARIIVADQMHSVRVKYGYRASLMTHDEVVVIVPKGEAELAARRLIDEMKIPPVWAPGLPLSAEGGFAENYGGVRKGK